jgi:hypothetical protein
MNVMKAPLQIRARTRLLPISTTHGKCAWEVMA